MRTIEFANRHLMGDHATERRARKPDVDMKRWRLDPEGRLAEMAEVEIDRMIRRRADCARPALEGRQCGAMHVARRNQLNARMAPDDPCKVVGIAQILTIHVPDAGLKRRMMHEQQRRPAIGRGETGLQPLQSVFVEFAVRLSGHA